MVRNGKLFLVIYNGRRWLFCKKNAKTIKVAHWSEMARNAIKIDFRLYKKAAGNHFVKKKFKKEAIYREMRSKVIFGHTKWLLATILWKKSKKLKVAFWSEMAGNTIKKWLFEKKLHIDLKWGKNVIKNDFKASKMTTKSHFVKQN